MNRATRLELGDWQTPEILSSEILGTLLSTGAPRPSTVVEPTCGRGSFLLAAAKLFPGASLWGADINPDHVSAASLALKDTRAAVVRGDFFKIDWRFHFQGERGPIWVVGNPPWVTASRLGVLGSANAPRRENLRALSGIEALTGKSNFDVSEWMLIRLVEALQGRDAILGMLCKAAVARKVIELISRNNLQASATGVWRIDAAAHFGAAVDAVLFACRTGSGTSRGARWPVYAGLQATRPEGSLGTLDGLVIPDVDAYQRTAHVAGRCSPAWRSGIKHDCAKVMELRPHSDGWENGQGEVVELEPDYLWPMLKSSDLANGRTQPTRWMLVPQQSLGESTEDIRSRAPKTWQYLQSHLPDLARRKSSIYRGRDPFAIFGVGEYSFAPYKVAVSGLYKRLEFRLLQPAAQKAVVLDDTCYFLPFDDEGEARAAHRALSGPLSRDFFHARIFWDAKRPITKDVLQAIDLGRLVA